MKLAIEKVVVEKYKSGEREGQWRMFEIPDEATVVSVAFLMERAIVYYVVKA